MPARVSLNDMGSMVDPQSTFDWAIWLPSVPGTPYSTRDFTFRATATTIPALTIEEIKVEAQGLAFNFGGKRTWEMKQDVTIYETRDGVGRNLVEGWLDYIRNVRANTGNYRDSYAVQAEVDLYDAAGVVTQRIGLSKFFPVSLSQASLDQSSGLLTYTVNCSYDRSIPLPLNG